MATLGPVVACGLYSEHVARAGSQADGLAMRAGQTQTGSYLAARHARAEHDEGAAAAFFSAALARSPDDGVLLSRTIAAMVLDGRTRDAIPLAKRLAAIEPSNDLAGVILAVAALRDGRYADVDNQVRSLADSSQGASTAPLLAAWAAFGRGDLNAALAALRPVAISPATAYLYPLHAAWLKDAAGDSKAAAEELNLVVSEQKDPWLRLTTLGMGVYQRAGRADDAEALRQRYLTQHPDSFVLSGDAEGARGLAGAAPPIRSAADGAAEALFDASGIFARQGNRDIALLLGQLGLYLKPDFPALQLVVADLMESFERLPEANQTYAAIASTSPLARVGRLSMAQNLDKLDRFDDAEKLLRTMAKERTDDPEPLIQLGDLYRRHERFAEAVVVYDEAATRIPKIERRHWRFLYARGIALERSKQWDRAEADLLKALGLEPDQPFVLNYLGYSWVEQGRNLDRAEGLIRRAVDLRPSDGYIVDSLGWVLYRLGRPEEAVPQMERAVELRPEDPVINDHLGDVYWAVGRQREARYQWRAALSRDPEPALRATIEQKLERGLLKEASATP